MRTMAKLGLSMVAMFAIGAGCTDDATNTVTQETSVDPTVSTDSATYPAGQAITISYSNLPGNPYDWVAISTANDPDTSYVEWEFTDGETSGSRTLAGLPAGDYEARAYLDNSFTRLATSTFTVTTVASPTLTTDMSTYPANANVTVTFSSMPGNTYDWIGVSAAGSDDTSYIAYAYLNGQTSGTEVFTGLAGGNYEARAYVNNSYTVLSRATFAIAATPTVSTAPTFLTGATITVNYSGLPGNIYDWVAVATAGSDDMSVIQWKYTNGELAGNRSFAALPVGNYEARVYLNNTFTRIATSTFSVTTGGPPPVPTVATDLSSYTPGQGITVTFTNLPGNAYDWIAIAPASSSDESYIQWKFTGGLVDGSKPFGGLPAGSYEARAYVNNSFTRVATSSFVVGP